MRFTLTINCDNAAFGERLSERHAEVRRILLKLCRRLDPETGDGSGNGGLSDANGNTVGRFGFEE